MTPDEQQAMALARWLDALERGGPVGEPPPDVDEDVLAAVFALRPDLAPPPRVDLDDILAGVTEGPFATLDEEPEGAEVVPFPVPAALPPEAATRRRRWWTGGLVGLVAAAAAALLMVGPLVQQGAPTAALQAERAAPERGPAPELAATPPPAEALAEDGVALAEASEQAETRGADDRPPAEPPRLSPRLAPAAPLAADRSGVFKSKQEAGHLDARDDDAVVTAEPLEQTAIDVEGDLGGWDEREADGLTGNTYEAPSFDGYGQGLRDEAPVGAGSGVGGYSAPAASQPSPPPPARRERKVAAMPPSVAPSAAGAAVDEVAVSATTAPVDDVRDVIAAASGRAVRDPLGAAREVAAHIAPPADAGLEAAEAAARWALAGGDPRTAAAYARRGLELPGGSAAARARVTRLLREAEDALGRTSEAR